MTTAETRGKLVIPEKVIEKVASQAAAELPDVGSAAGGFLGVRARTDFDARPKVDVELSGRVATLTLDVGIRYPAPLRQTTDTIRRHVMARVHALTGVEVRQVDIDVSWLHTAETGAQGRVLQ